MISKILVFTFLIAGTGVFGNSIDPKELMRQIVRQQCQEVGAEDKADEVINAGPMFLSCLSQLVNFDQLQNEVKNANGTLNFVLKKYCAKAPQLKSCMFTYLDSNSQCASSHDYDVISKNRLGATLDYVCYEDGNRIARFCTEHGPECIQEKSRQIQECFFRVFGNLSMRSYDKLTTSEKCSNEEAVSACIITGIKQCSNPTPGNMLESLQNYISREFPCNTTKQIN